MKRITHFSVKTIIVILFLHLFAASSVFAALNGLSYTINPGNPATAINYQSIASAVSDLTSGTRADGGPVQGPGISGQVEITVTASSYTYTGTLDITTITGAGTSGDSVIFNGGSAAISTLQITSASGNNYLIQLDNCSYVTIENFTITSTLTAGYNFDGVVIEGPNSSTPISHDDVINCTINMLSDSVAVTLGGGTFSGIVVNGWTSGDGNTPAITGYFSNIYLTGNTITNGHYGIVAFGNGATPSGVTIVGNTITGFSTYGIGLYSVVCPKIKNNVINGGASVLANGANLARGIAMNTAANQSSTTDWVEISGNHIICLCRYGILLNGACGTSSQPTRIYNNMVYMYSTVVTAARGISTLNSTFSPGNSYINYWNNSILLNTPSTSASGALSLDNGAANSDIRNNILGYIGSSTGLPLLVPTLANVTAFDYNIFYNSAATNEGSIGGTTYTSTTILNNNYGGSTTFNANSQVTNPNFVSDTDLDITSQCQRGTGFTLTEVPTDIHGTKRANPPCIGADEIPRLSVSTSDTNASCSSCNDGNASAIVSYGTPPYTYKWSNNDTTKNISDLLPGVYTVCVTDSFGCEVCDTLSISFATGINELAANNNNLSIYPNPSSGQFTINLSNNQNVYSVEVYNVMGEKIYQSILSNSQNNINLSTQPTGMYFVYLKSAESVEVGKMLVTK